MNKKKILAELVGYLVRKEFTIYEVLDAYYEESERHFFEDKLPEVTIPSEEQKEPDDNLTGTVADAVIIDTVPAPETKVTEPETIETPAETKVTEPETKVTVVDGEYKLRDIHKLYHGYFYENVKDFILDGKTIAEHLKENNILPVRFYDRMNSKGWTVRKAATTPINAKYDYSQIMPNGKTIMQNLNDLGLGKNTFCYRVRKGYSLYEACTISEYDMRSKQTTKGVRAWKKGLEEKLKAENESQEQPKVTEQEPKQEPKKKPKKEPKQESKREYILDDPPAKNVVPSSIPDLTIVDVCQNMKISVKRLKDRIDKGTFPKPDKGNKWSYAAVRFYFPNWG